MHEAPQRDAAMEGTMIVDNIKNIAQYKALPELAQVVEYLECHDLRDLPVGTTHIDGDNLYVMIQNPTLKRVEDARPEAHELYADLQLIIEGEEIMGYAPIKDLGEPTENPEGKDICFYDGKGGAAFSQIVFKAGDFAVFYPQDGHAPCISNGAEKDIKAVFKIRL